MSEAAPGFVSKAQKNSLVFRLMLLLIPVLLLQLALPMLFAFGYMLYALYGVFSSGVPELDEIVGDESAVYWVVARPDFGDAASDIELYTLPKRAGETIELVATKQMAKPVWLLREGSTLFLCNEHKVLQAEQGSAPFRQIADFPRFWGKPFVAHGKLTVLAKQDDSPRYIAKSLVNGKWIQQKNWPDTIPAFSKYDYKDAMDIIYSDDMLHVWVESSQRLYYRFYDMKNDTLNNWHTVHDLGNYASRIMAWDSCVGPTGEPYLMVVEDNPLGEQMLVYHKRGWHWKQALSQRIGNILQQTTTLDIGCYTAGESVRLMRYEVFGRYDQLDYAQNTLKDIGSYDNGSINLIHSIFLFIIIFQVFSLLTLLVIVPLSSSMKRAKIASMVFSGNEYRFARMGKRVWAKLFDMTLYVGLPSVLICIMVIITAWDGNLNMVAKHAYVNILGASLIFGCCFMGALLCWSMLEYRGKQTLGKKLLRIQVVSLQNSPPAFIAYFIRNALLVVDGLFTGMLAVMIIALSEKWQRLGDHAAHTIVVEKKPATEA